MREKSSIEILEDFATRKGIKFYTNSSVKNYILVQNEKYLNTKFVVFDMQNISSKLFLIFYDSYSTKAYTGFTYCGLFKAISECRNEISIINRKWIDYFSFRKRIKTGDSYLDKKLTITGDTSELDRNLFTNYLLKKYIELSKRIRPLKILTTISSMSIVPELNGNNLIALQTNEWLLQDEDIEVFIDKGIELFVHI